jgi:hypothetical protein
MLKVCSDEKSCGSSMMVSLLEANLTKCWSTTSLIVYKGIETVFKVCSTTHLRGNVPKPREDGEHTCVSRQLDR